MPTIGTALARAGGGGHEPTAAIPLVSAVFSVGAGLSALGLLASVVSFPTTAPTTATLLGLGVAVDYGLFLVSRHREQLDTGMDVIESASRAEGTSGAAVVVAGSTVVISILGLYVVGVSFVGALGLAAAIAVAVTMLAALTMVPALMGLVRGSVRSLPDRLRARKQGVSSQQQARQTAAATQEQHEHSAFARWGRMVSNHPRPWGVPRWSSWWCATQSLLSTMRKDVSATSGVASAGPASVNSAANTAVFSVVPTTRPQATATTSLVIRLRDDVLPREHVTSYVTGTTAGSVDFTRQITSRMAWLILVVVAIAFVLLTMAFRSVVIATKAAILNLLSIGAAYGVIVAIFQWGWGASLLGVPSTLPIPAYVPALVFCIVFGLSMDYEVFLLSRVHEAWITTRDPHRAVAIGIGSTARVITTAAAIMVAVFASFVLSTDPTVKMLAVGMAFAC